MPSKIQLISTDFDGTLVSHASDPVFDRDCMELIRELQCGGAIWAINTGRSVALLEEGLEDFAFPLQPDFILTSERDVFRPTADGWEPFGDWNARCAQAHAELYDSASAILAEVVDFVSRQTKARVIYEADEPAGLIATSEEEMDRLAEFIDQAKAKRTEISLPAQHCLPALLPHRLSQGRRLGGTVPPNGNPARRDLRGGRSSQRPSDARRPLRRASGLSGQCHRRSERKRCGAPAAGLRKRNSAPASTKRFSISCCKRGADPAIPRPNSVLDEELFALEGDRSHESR